MSPDLHLLHQQLEQLQQETYSNESEFEPPLPLDKIEEKMQSKNMNEYSIPTPQF